MHNGIVSLETLIDPMSAPIWKMARRMRIRPEAVFDRLSEAYDKSMRENTLRSDEAGIHFETDFASITLLPQGENTRRIVQYKAKATMMNSNCLPHPKELYVWPERLENHVFFPEQVIFDLNALITGKRDRPPNEWLEQIMNSYRVAYERGELVLEGDCLWFDTGLKGASGGAIYGAIEPSVYDPIPNTWVLSRVEIKN